MGQAHREAGAVSDIVDRLRALDADFLHEEAAEEIERLRAALKQAEEGLREAGAIYGADAVRAALGTGQ